MTSEASDYREVAEDMLAAGLTLYAGFTNSSG